MIVERNPDEERNPNAGAIDGEVLPGRGVPGDVKRALENLDCAAEEYRSCYCDEEIKAATRPGAEGKKESHRPVAQEMKQGKEGEEHGEGPVPGT